jgi:ankyrin repeat protein
LPHRTALHGAAMKGFNPIVEFLVAHGAELNATDANGRTPLDLAMGRYEENYLRQAAEPHVETVQLLEKLIADSTRAGSEVANRR